VTRSPSTPVHDRFVHEALYYETADQLVATAAPALRRALADGDDVILVCSEANNQRLREALDDEDVHRLLLLDRAEVYTKAVAAVTYFRDFVQERLSAGAPRVCVLGEVDFGSDSRAPDEWRRYEALLNYALDSSPLWSLCGYNTRVLQDHALTTSELTHPFVRREGVQAPNPRQVDSAELLRTADADSARAPAGEPGLSISDLLDLSALHRQVTAFLADLGVAPQRIEDFVMAVHEVTINGLRHGRPPVVVRMWAAPDRVDCSVTDHGAGVADPFAGYLRGGGDELPEGRFGLWLARQLCDEVVLNRTSEGFTTRLVLDR
jgi:anti-sigma regulatory factor (Ser/Thr protein kinase)